eukprot:CAMPEP_0172522420 /NCGR_PEP_ID=MMETSP1066-20121228/293109_1 /TAXON_ID=671091 /ORGANISM="Coscinodiscus wailesii, Strain CCMP2513" /LENGTH=844 /DNA_ID=CAMNT_0013305417 /DNA_START=45 /DNA_END=2575 /DNA_ORIENTATION=+
MTRAEDTNELKQNQTSSVRNWFRWLRQPAENEMERGSDSSSSVPLLQDDAATEEVVATNDTNGCDNDKHDGCTNASQRFIDGLEEEITFPRAAATPVQANDETTTCERSVSVPSDDPVEEERDDGKDEDVCATTVSQEANNFVKGECQIDTNDNNESFEAPLFIELAGDGQPERYEFASETTARVQEEDTGHSQPAPFSHSVNGQNDDKRLPSNGNDINDSSLPAVTESIIAQEVKEEMKWSASPTNQIQDVNTNDCPQSEASIDPIIEEEIEEEKKSSASDKIQVKDIDTNDYPPAAVIDHIVEMEAGEEKKSSASPTNQVEDVTTTNCPLSAVIDSIVQQEKGTASSTHEQEQDSASSFCENDDKRLPSNGNDINDSSLPAVTESIIAQEVKEEKKWSASPTNQIQDVNTNDCPQSEASIDPIIEEEIEEEKKSSASDKIQVKDIDTNDYPPAAVIDHIVEMEAGEEKKSSASPTNQVEDVTTTNCPLSAVIDSIVQQEKGTASSTHEQEQDSASSFCENDDKRLPSNGNDINDSSLPAVTESIIAQEVKEEMKWSASPTNQIQDVNTNDCPQSEASIDPIIEEEIEEEKKSSASDKIQVKDIDTNDYPPAAVIDHIVEMEAGEEKKSSASPTNQVEDVTTTNCPLSAVIDSIVQQEKGTASSTHEQEQDSDSSFCALIDSTFGKNNVIEPVPTTSEDDEENTVIDSINKNKGDNEHSDCEDEYIYDSSQSESTDSTDEDSLPDFIEPTNNAETSASNTCTTNHSNTNGTNANPILPPFSPSILTKVRIRMPSLNELKATLETTQTPTNENETSKNLILPQSLPENTSKSITHDPSIPSVST